MNFFGLLMHIAKCEYIRNGPQLNTVVVSQLQSFPLATSLFSYSFSRWLASWPPPCWLLRLLSSPYSTKFRSKLDRVSTPTFTIIIWFNYQSLRYTADDDVMHVKTLCTFANCSIHKLLLVYCRCK